MRAEMPMSDVESHRRSDLDELPSFADVAWSDVAACDDAPTHVPTGDEPAEVVTVILRATLVCPRCGDVHEDVGVWATYPHRTHRCDSCGLWWRVVVTGAPGAELGAVEALGAKVEDLVSANRLLEGALAREQQRRLAADERAALAHRRAENAEHRAAEAERRAREAVAGELDSLAERWSVAEIVLDVGHKAAAAHRLYPNGTGWAATLLPNGAAVEKAPSLSAAFFRAAALVGIGRAVDGGSEAAAGAESGAEQPAPATGHVEEIRLDGYSITLRSAPGGAE